MSIACLALICSLILALASPPARAVNWRSWLNPSTAPFIPIPEIDTDPDSGHTVGLIPTWLQTDASGNINRIIAPQLYKNSYFGYGVGASLYDYPSEDTQWSLEGDTEQRVEREVEFDFWNGLRRLGPWSFSAQAHYDRHGTPRFFGIGNTTSRADQTNYTSEAVLAQVMPGWNISRALQLAYLLRLESVDVTPGTIAGVVSIDRRFGARNSLGTTTMTLNRLQLIYDTRDSPTLPTRGVELVGYGGFAARGGFLNASMYSEVGVDARAFVPFGARTVLALHSALRYLPEAHRLPFWAFSTVGGDRSVIGGEQPLRGFGAGRFTGRDSFSFSAELRRTVTTVHAFSSAIDLQLAPFVDAGRVFRRSSTDPLSQLHKVAGLGIRGVARPYIVGYIDMGYGSEGLAVFTGINYPF